MDPERLIRAFDRKAARSLAWVSGLFSLTVALGLVCDALGRRPMLHFDSPILLEGRAALRADPNQEALIERIRAEDQVLREEFFLSRDRLLLGGYLLFGGLLVFALSLRRMVFLSEGLPVPVSPEDLVPHPKETRLALISALSLAAPTALVVFAAFALNREQGELAAVGGSSEQVLLANAPPPAPPVPEELKWPEFRGPNGIGIAPPTELPQSWNTDTGENILWKAQIPLPGNSSPILWGDRLFLTCADLSARKVLCLDPKTGAVRWTCALITPGLSMEEIEEKKEATLAAPTPVTDGKRVYAYFGTNELAAVDFEGHQAWSKWFGAPDNNYGVSSSLRLHENLILLQLDQGGGPEDGKSRLYGIDAATGNVVWEVKREVSASWSSPILISSPTRSELLTAAKPWVISYDPKTGKELWRAKVLQGEVAPLPVHADGLAYTVTEYAQLTAIRVGGEGDVTNTHVAWTFDQELPDVASPVTDGRFLILPNSAGKVRCLDAKTGKVLWTQRFKSTFWSSPTLVGDRVYLTDNEGKTTVFKMAETYEQVAQSDLGEPVITSIAIADSRIYVRGKEHLFCIGAKP
ncbi:MAG: PQQ-binding-like beta-propeller repeat protein [Candidatus Omnitrophica bacterium]|nr:PQQ-binding-like beta-propeller repeat protein [Candidatus Omnitrophota bacterium]